MHAVDTYMYFKEFYIILFTFCRSRWVLAVSYARRLWSNCERCSSEDSYEWERSPCSQGVSRIHHRVSWWNLHQGQVLLLLLQLTFCLIVCVKDYVFRTTTFSENTADLSVLQTFCVLNMRNDYMTTEIQ